MGSFTVTRWRCDRCGVEEEKKPSRFDASVTLVATEIGEWAGSTVIQWNELCHPCNRIVSRAIEELKVAVGREGQSSG